MNREMTTVKDYENIPAGSVIYDVVFSKKGEVMGFWSSPFGTIEVRIPIEYFENKETP